MTDLELRLQDLADHLDVPPGDGLAAAVVVRIAQARPRRRWRRWLAGLLLALGLGAAITPAVADRLGIGDVDVVRAPAPVADPLDLGRPISLSEVRARTGFQPLVPSVLGPPDEVWLDDRGPANLVWLRWRGGPLVTEVAGTVPDEGLVRKFAQTARVEALVVGGRPARWIEGAHDLVVSVNDGGAVVVRSRRSDSALLVEVDGVTIRIETPDRAAAIRIARSLGT